MSTSSNQQDVTASSRAYRAGTIGLSFLFAAVLAACGGGGGGDRSTDPTHASVGIDGDEHVPEDAHEATAAEDSPALVTGPTQPAAGPVSGRLPRIARFGAAPVPGELTAPVPGALNMVDIRLAQSHVVPNGKRVWTQPELPQGTQTLRLATARDTFALVRLSAKDAVNPVIEVWDRGELSDTIALQPPSALPATEDGGPRLGDDFYSARIPGDYIWSGVELKVKAQNYGSGNSLPIDVSAEYHEDLFILPIYLFGSTPENSGYSVEEYGAPSALAARELNARMPFDLNVRNHGARKAVWESLPVAPDGTRPARMLRDYDDGGLVHSLTLGLLDGMRRANGQNQSPVTYYSPVAGRRSDGSLRLASGGLGWGGSAVGHWKYSRTFIHELGHTFGMNHAGDMYRQGRYPYPNGSLLGSTWGWDAAHSIFLPTIVPPSASSYRLCEGRVRDEQGRCVKQDVMEGGDADKVKDTRFGMFSDFSAAVMQGRMEFYSVMPEGDGSFVRFNLTTRQYESFNATTTNYAMDGIAQMLPTQVDVPVYTLFLSVSATTPEVNHFLAPLKYRGNLLGRIDPTNAQDRAAIDPAGTGVYRNFCRRTGCDYTLRLTYEDGSQGFQLIQGAFRTANSPSGAMAATASNPLDANSYRRWVVNVPGVKPLRKVELLYTPEAWKGLPQAPQVVMARDIATQ